MSYINRIMDSSQGIRPGLSSIDNRKFLWPAVIAGVSMLGSAVANMLSNSSNNKKQEALVAQQNEYNKPVNQVARLRDAGLNPYMMLGSLNSGNQQSVASTQPTDYSGVAQAGSAVASVAQQALVNRAQIRNIDADTRLKNIQGDTQRDLVNAQISQLLGSSNLANANAGYIGSQHRWWNDSYADRLQRERYGWKGLSQQIAESQANQDLANMRVDREHYELLLRKTFGYRMSQAELNQALAAYDFAQSNIAVNRAQVGYIGAQTGLVGAQTLTERERKGLVNNQKRSEFWHSRENYWNSGVIKNAYDYYHTDKVVDYLGRIVSGGSEVYSKTRGRK